MIFFHFLPFFIEKEYNENLVKRKLFNYFHFVTFKGTMKKLLCILSIIFTLLTLWGCLDPTEPEESNSEIEVIGLFPAENDNFTILAGKSTHLDNTWETNDTLLFIQINNDSEIQSTYALPTFEQPNVQASLLSNGNILLFGNLSNYYSWEYSAWEYTPAGTQEWELSLGEQVNGICPSNDGNLFVFSQQSSENNYPYSYDYDDLLITKIRTDADTIWSKRYPTYNWSTSLRTGIASADNGCIAIGRKWQQNRGSDIWVMKFSEQGDSVWSGLYGGDRYDDIHSVSTLSDGSILVCAELNLYDTTNTDWSLNSGQQVYLIKLSENGNKIWTKAIGPTLRESLNAFIEASDGSLIVCGTRDESYAYIFDETVGWIAKLSTNGNLVWQQEFENKIPVGIRELSNGDFLAVTKNLTGNYYEYTKDLNIIKLSASGTLLMNEALIP